MLRACVSADDFVKQLDADGHSVLPCTFFPPCTLSSCCIITRIDATGNHWRVIVLRIWECMELKNESVCGSI